MHLRFWLASLYVCVRGPVDISLASYFCKLADLLKSPCKETWMFHIVFLGLLQTLVLPTRAPCSLYSEICIQIQILLQRSGFESQSLTNVITELNYIVQTLNICILSKDLLFFVKDVGVSHHRIHSTHSKTPMDQSKQPCKPFFGHFRSISGRKLCSSCGQALGKGAAMIIETLGLYFHIQCFRVGFSNMFSLPKCCLPHCPVVLARRCSSLQLGCGQILSQHHMFHKGICNPEDLGGKTLKTWVWSHRSISMDGRISACHAQLSCLPQSFCSSKCPLNFCS